MKQSTAVLVGTMHALQAAGGVYGRRQLPDIANLLLLLPGVFCKWHVAVAAVLVVCWNVLEVCVKLL